MGKIICGAWHTEIAKIWEMNTDESTRRIFACNPNNETSKVLYPIGVDEKYIFDGRDEYNRLNFLINYQQSYNLIVLSEKEKELLVTSGISHAEKIIIFEKMYPYYKDIKFVNNSRKNHQHLLHLYEDLRRRNMERETTNFWSKKFLYKIARKIKNRSMLDSSFAQASISPYQEAFKLVESRLGRKIIALDFNSMFGDCMDGKFAHPGQLVRKEIKSFYKQSTDLPSGLYRVCLIHPLNDFIKKYHALKYVSLNEKFSFTLSNNDDIEVLLHSNEIDFYSKHFKNIYIFEGVFSPKSIKHPLLNEARRVYTQRVNYKKQNNLILERACKLKIATMHSAVKRKKYDTKVFKSFSSAQLFLRDNFGLIRPESMHPRDFLSYISNGSQFKITINEDITIKYLLHNDNSLVFSLFSQVIANARVKMMKTIEYILMFPEAEICYSNIDSLHISLPAESVGFFLQYAAPLIGEEMGQLKVETQADQGYWFEAGRYWLIKENKVVMHKNQGLHNPYVSNLFQSSRSYYKYYTEKNCTIPVRCRRDISDVLTYRKKLLPTQDANHICFTRFEVKDLITESRIKLSILDEVKKSCNYKMELFDRISRIYRDLIY